GPLMARHESQWRLGAVRATHLDGSALGNYRPEIQNVETDRRPRQPIPLSNESKRRTRCPAGTLGVGRVPRQRTLSCADRPKRSTKSTATRRFDKKPAGAFRWNASCNQARTTSSVAISFLCEPFVFSVSPW